MPFFPAKRGSHHQLIEEAGVSPRGITKQRSSSDNLFQLSSKLEVRDVWMADKHVGLKGDPNLKHGLSLEEHPSHGIIVSRVSRAGLAYRNGMLSGDLLFELNGHPVTSATDVLKKLDALDKNGRMTLTASGNTTSLTLDKKGGILGLTCSAPMSASARGALIQEIAADSQGEKSTLKPGDHILSVNELYVHTHEEAVARMNAAAREVRLVILPADSGSTHQLARSGGPMYPPLPPQYATVTFTAGPLGVTLKRSLDDVAIVDDVETPSQAECQGVLPGAQVLGVAGSSVEGLEYCEVVRRLKEASRPVSVLLIMPTVVVASNLAAAAV